MPSTSQTSAPPRVIVDRDGAVAVVQIGVAGSVNALDPALLDELDAALAALAADGAVRCAVLTGVGAAFAAGADLRHVRACTVEENLVYGDRLRDSFDAVAALPFPTIAAINGHALGGGLELALACTLRIAAAGVPIGLPESRLGLVPAAGGVQRIVRTVLRGVALELMLTARHLDAEEAQRAGIVDRVVAPEDLLDAARETAARIARNSPAAIRAVLTAVRDGAGLPLAEAQDLTRVASAEALASGEWREGIDAFLEKRRPRFETATAEVAP